MPESSFINSARAQNTSMPQVTTTATRDGSLAMKLRQMKMEKDREMAEKRDAALEALNVAAEKRAAKAQEKRDLAAQKKAAEREAKKQQTQEKRAANVAKKKEIAEAKRAIIIQQREKKATELAAAREEARKRKASELAAKRKEDQHNRASLKRASSSAQTSAMGGVSKNKKARKVSMFDELREPRK